MPSEALDPKLFHHVQRVEQSRTFLKAWFQQQGMDPQTLTFDHSLVCRNPTAENPIGFIIHMPHNIIHMPHEGVLGIWVTWENNGTVRLESPVSPTALQPFHSFSEVIARAKTITIDTTAPLKPERITRITTRGSLRKTLCTRIKQWF